jgi:thiol-disulfide isomerase/thioredoxin
MLRPQIDDMVKLNRTKYDREDGALLGIDSNRIPPQSAQQATSSVRKPTTIQELDALLSAAGNSCAMVFFTSPTCGPCKTLYPVYDELAVSSAHKATLILVDISRAYDISTKYQIRATPTFMTFLHGKEENRWTGSNPTTLRTNLQILIQIAWPPHPHQSLHLSVIRGSTTKPVLYSKVPPLEKLKAKMGASADNVAIASVLSFVSARLADGAAEATLPDLNAFSQFLRSATSELPPEIMFTIVDLLRVALVDPRLSGYYAEENNHKTIAPLISYTNSLKDCPYSLRLVTLQAACNLFSSPLYPPHILGCSDLTVPIIELVTTSLLDVAHNPVRVAAASLAFNISAANSIFREEEHSDALSGSAQVELAASLLESIGAEKESPDALKGFLLAFGYLIYCAPNNGELVDLLKSMDAQETVLGKAKSFPNEALVNEIGNELLGHILD